MSLYYLQNLGSDATQNNIDKSVNDIHPVAMAGGKMNFGGPVASGEHTFQGKTTTAGPSFSFGLTVAPAFTMANSFSNTVQVGPKSIGLGQLILI